MKYLIILMVLFSGFNHYSLASVLVDSGKMEDGAMVLRDETEEEYDSGIYHKETAGV